jgi:hypothetical protein
MSQHSRSKILTVCFSAAAAIGALLVCSSQAGGALISGVGAAELMTEGSYSGWYKYTYTVTWDLSKDLSHLDLVVPDCSTGGWCQFAFDTDAGGSEDGHSTGSDYHTGQPVVFSVPYAGAFEPRGDPSISLAKPLIKWEPYSCRQPGKDGVGEFWFYSTGAPITGLFDDVWAAKFGQNTVYGDLTGAYPTCDEPVPEPATLAYLAVGVAAALVNRRRRRGRRGEDGIR